MTRSAFDIVLEIEDPRWTAALPDVAAILEKSIALAPRRS